MAYQVPLDQQEPEAQEESEVQQDLLDLLGNLEPQVVEVCLDQMVLLVLKVKQETEVKLDLMDLRVSLETWEDQALLDFKV